MSEIGGIDVLVVGSGLAGLSAACRAAETGCRVLVLEKFESIERLTRNSGPTARGASWEEPPTGCNTELSQRGVSSLEIQGGQVNPRLTVDEVVRRSVASGHGAVNEPVIRAWAGRLNADIEWVTQKAGVRRRERRPGVPDYRFGQIVVPMTEYLKRLGGTVHYGVVASELLVEEGRRPVGVRGFCQNGLRDYRAAAVVLAPGGFAGNAELCSLYVDSYVGNEILLTGSPYNAGEWVHMAHQVGAKLINMNQVHVRTPDRRGGLGLKRLENLSRYGLVVDECGQRIYDEARLPEQTDLLAHEMMARRTNAWLIFDATLQNRFREEYVGYRSTPEDFFCAASSLDELAAIEGIDPAGLRRTISGFNESVQADGTAPEADPPKGMSEDFPRSAVRLERPPFYSFKLLVGLNQTMGGFKVDTQMRVLDLMEQPIPGLYAAGEPVMGNIIYDNYKVACDAATGLEMALSTGCMAGEAAAAFGCRQESWRR